MPEKKYSLKGTLTVSIRKNQLEAILSFTPGSDTHLWGISDLISFLTTHAVKEGYSPQNLEKILRQLEKGSQPLEVIVAKGTPPEHPEPEKAIWQELPIPESFKPDAETAFSSAGNPIITQEKVERKKVEKWVEKKSPLPFLPPKKEPVTTFEKKVIQERVYVDPTVVGKGYVIEGSRIALIEPFKEGIPGRGVTGALILPEPLTDPYVYAGKGVEKKNGELIARQTGFVRWGKNWVEILPFKPHVWEVSLSSDKATCYLSFTPGSREARVPSASEILQAAEKLPYPREFLQSDEEIDSLVQHILSLGKPVQKVPISRSEDAKIEIRVTEDKLKAYLYLRKGRGKGKPLSLKEVGSLIKQSNLKGLDFARIQADIPAFYQGNEQELTEYLLAEGKAPTPGQDRKFEWSVRFFEKPVVEQLKKAARENQAALEGIRSLSVFPVESVEEMAPVEKEQRIVVMSPIVPGQPGVDVFGNVLPGLPGKDPRLVLYENLEKKQNVIISTLQGVLEKRTTGESIELRVRPHKDGQVKVTISPNRMEGFLTLFPSQGTGKPITFEWIQQEISRAGIVKGLQEDLLQTAWERVREGEPVIEAPIAIGQPPQEGSSNRIKFLIHLATHDRVNIRSDGTADYKTRDVITTVKQGDLIAEVMPPEIAPQDGWDVTGKPIPAKGSTPFDLEIGPNIHKEEQNGKILLVADGSGELLYDKKRILVQNAHVIKGNVDLSTGNIKFPGSVLVSGSVATGFYIMSGGDIKVAEGVEASLLSADGSIYIQQGVKGGGKAVLRTKKNVYASFVEQATVLAVGDVIIKNACLRCMIKSNGKVELTSEKGIVIGGTIKARYGVFAAGLGTEKGVPTEISFGQNYLIADQIDLEEKEIRKLNTIKNQIDHLIRQCENQGDKKKLEAYRTEKLKTLKLIESHSLRLFNLREKYEEHFPSEIIVRGTVYPGVVIESHGRFHAFAAPKKNIRITFEPSSGRITESPLN
jgi:uncharacterized protein (DUF342 family)